MNDNIPEWLRPYIKSNSYTPTKEDIENLDPQSRKEMLLKYTALNSSGGDSGGGVDPSIIERTATNITVDMLKGVTSIGSNAFSYSQNLASITIPNSVTSIGSNAFNCCTQLTSIEIPNSVAIIECMVFYGCQNLVSITIPKSVTRMADDYNYRSGGALGGSYIQNVVFENGILTIPLYACYRADKLISAVIPDSVTSIGYNAFGYCQRLTTLTVKAVSPPSISDYPFSGSPNLMIYVPAESVDAYKAASDWSEYADKIQAIPNS